jgi:hypothetical protein
MTPRSLPSPHTQNPLSEGAKVGLALLAVTIVGGVIYFATKKSAATAAATSLPAASTPTSQLVTQSNSGQTVHAPAGSQITVSLPTGYVYTPVATGGVKLLAGGGAVAVMIFTVTASGTIAIAGIPTGGIPVPSAFTLTVTVP